jgi:lipopolysaccharide transport system permease protein
VIEAGRSEQHYWAELWRYRQLMYILAWRDLAVRYKQTMIGVAWALIRPALTMTVFVVFRRLVGLTPGDVPEPILVLVAVLPWQFFSSALLESSSSLIHNANLISKIYFPRLVIPCAALVTTLVDFLITLVMLSVLMLWYGFLPGWRLVILPLFILLTCALSLGLGLILAALNVKYRDFRYIVPFIIQFWLFVSPIAFTTANVPERWRTLYALNPLAGAIDGFRWSILGGSMPLYPQTVGLFMAVAACSLFLGVWHFRRMERGFADAI